MNAIGKNISALIIDRDTTQSAIAAIAEVSQGAVSSWISGRNEPRTKYLERIAEYYDITVDDLRSDDKGLYAKLHGLTSAPEGALAPAVPRRAYAPLVGRVHAGDATEPDIIDYEVPIPYEVSERHPDGYFLEVEGTCMNRVYPEGSHVLIDPTGCPSDGSIAVVSIDGEYVMRRLHMGSSVMLLSPESYDDYDDIVVYDGKVEFVGTVVWFQASEELG